MDAARSEAVLPSKRIKDRIWYRIAVCFLTAAFAVFAAMAVLRFKMFRDTWRNRG